MADGSGSTVTNCCMIDEPVHQAGGIMNIFARELKELLEDNGKGLGSLYGLHSDTYRIMPNKVRRIQRSLTQDITATLNTEELDLLAEWLDLDPTGEEIRRLRAALVAESVRHLLSGRINRDQALSLGEITFELLLGQESEEFLSLRDRLLEGVRGGLPWGQSEVDALWDVTEENDKFDHSWDDQIEQALEPAVETYEQGALWLEVARDTSDYEMQRGYIAQAQALLNRAHDLANHSPAITQGTREQSAWLSIIEVSLNEVLSLT